MPRTIQDDVTHAVLSLRIGEGGAMRGLEERVGALQVEVFSHEALVVLLELFARELHTNDTRR